jgi:hypothetical protein
MNRRITDLPITQPDEHNIVHMASFDTEGVTRRIMVSEYVFETEEEAIDRVKTIFSKGLKAFVMPFKA